VVVAESAQNVKDGLQTPVLMKTYFFIIQIYGTMLLENVWVGTLSYI